MLCLQFDLLLLQLMNFTALLASYDPKVLKTDSIVFSGELYTPHELAAMGWRWTPILRARSRVECSNCKFKCDIQPNISNRHVQAQQSCPLAQIWKAREDAAENGWSIHPNTLFNNPKSPEGIEIRLETFIPKQRKKYNNPLDLKWCRNINAPSPQLLAQNGFYYDPKHSMDDRCTCMYCGIHIQDWTSSQEIDIELVHSQANDKCWVWTHQLLMEKEMAAQLQLETQKNRRILSHSELMASFNGKTINGQTIEFKGSIYPRNVLANMGWLWKPTLERQLLVECFYCKYQCDVQNELCSVHLENSPSCPFALIMASIVKNMEGPNQNTWKSDDIFKDPSSEESKNIRLLTFPVGESWCLNKKAPLPSLLVSNGFYYNPKITNDDRCTCMYCGLDLSGWEDGDENEVKLGHINESPECYTMTYRNSPQISPIEDEDIPIFNSVDPPLIDQEKELQLLSTPPLKKKNAGTSEDPIDLGNETIAIGGPPVDLTLHVVEPDEMEDLLSKVSSPDKSSPVNEKQPFFPTLKSTDLSEFFSELDTDQNERRPLSYFKNRPPIKKSQLQDDEHSPIVYHDFNEFDGFADSDEVIGGDRSRVEEPVEPTQELARDFQEDGDLEHEMVPPQVEKRFSGPIDDNTNKSEMSVDKFYDATEVVIENKSSDIEQIPKAVDDDKDQRIKMLENALELLKRQFNEFNTKSPNKLKINDEVEEIVDTYDEIKINKGNVSLSDSKENIPPLANVQDNEYNDSVESKNSSKAENSAKVKRRKSQIDVDNTDKKEERRLKKIKKKMMKQRAQAADTTDDLLHLSREVKEVKIKKKKERERDKIKKEKKKAKKLKKSIFSQTQTQSQHEETEGEEKDKEDNENEVPHLQLPSSEIDLVDIGTNAITPIHRLKHSTNVGIDNDDNDGPVFIGPIKASILDEDAEEVSPTLQKSLGRTTDIQRTQLSISSGKLESLDKIMMLSPPMNGIQSSSPMPVGKYKVGNDMEMMMSDLIGMGGNQSTPHHHKIVNDVIINKEKRGDRNGNLNLNKDGNKYQDLYNGLSAEICYVKEVVDSKYEMLSEDLDGLLTEFVNELKPEQLEMTIRELLLHQQNHAETHIRKKCTEMQKLFKSQCQMAIEKLESL